MPHCIISPSSPEMFSPRVAEKELTRLFRREYIYDIKIIGGEKNGAGLRQKVHSVLLNMGFKA